MDWSSLWNLAGNWWFQLESSLLGRLCHLETFFGIGGGNNDSLTGSGEGVDRRLLDKYTLVRSEAKSDGVVLSVNIALLTSLLMLSGGGDMLLIMVRSFGEESSIKSTLWELISLPGVSRSSRRYPFDLSVYQPSIQTFTAWDCNFLSYTGFSTWAYLIDPKIHKWNTSGFCLVQTS